MYVHFVWNFFCNHANALLGFRTFLFLSTGVVVLQAEPQLALECVKNAYHDTWHKLSPPI